MIKKNYFSCFNAKLIKDIILSSNVFFQVFWWNKGIFYFQTGLGKNDSRKSLRSSLHIHLRQHRKQKLSPGHGPLLTFLWNPSTIDSMALLI